jgi:hypothetical protein
MSFEQHGVCSPRSGLNSPLRFAYLSHDIIPFLGLAPGKRLQASHSPAIAGNDKRLALFELVQDAFRFLMQLLCGNRSHAEKVTPF